MSSVTAEEREQIVQALKAGHSQNRVAKESGRGAATVNRIARSEGLEYSAPENAAVARIDYCQANRLKLLNRFFDKAGEILENVASPIELQQLSTAMAILTDKRRLEDGEATSRAEVSNGHDTRARLAGRLDELAERRTAKSIAERVVG